MFQKATAKRMISTLLENTNFVCGSIKDTLSEKENVERIKSLMACNNTNNPNNPMASSPESMDVDNVFFDNDFLDHGGEDLLDHHHHVNGSGEDGSVKQRESSRRYKKRDHVDNNNNNANNTEEHHYNGNTHHHHHNNNNESYNTLTIGLCLSRRHPTLGHPDTITRQTSFDFNELQDREYNYVSSTDSSGWLAGGGEKGGKNIGINDPSKLPAPDKVHIPIITVENVRSDKVDEIVSALANGEVFIPHMAVLPEALSVSNNGRSSPPDLIVRFDCEKNDDAPPEEWPNWCLEFIHNQLYELLLPMNHVNVLWTKRPFQITLARKVKWKTAKHMNKYFAHAEQVVNGWREKGPQYLQPPDTNTDNNNNNYGATREETDRPHGIYLLRNGIPTNYFAPNFEPPYTRKVTRSLIRNVVSQSWDTKRRDWLVEPIPRSMGPLKVMSNVFGCEGGNGAQLSPVEGGGGGVNHTTFDLTKNGNTTMDSFDIIVQHNQGGENGGGGHHSQSRASASSNVKGKLLSPGRRSGRKETIESNVVTQETGIANDSPSRRGNSTVNNGEVPNVTNSVPSDESFNMSPRPTETLSMEETIESTTNECLISQSSIESTTASSTQYSKSTTVSSSRQSVKEEHPVEQELFSPIMTPQRKVTPKITTPKQVIREEKPQPQQQFVGAVNNMNTTKPAEQQLRNPFTKVEDTKAEKFAKTKVSGHSVSYYYFLAGCLHSCLTKTSSFNHSQKEEK